MKEYALLFRANYDAISSIAGEKMQAGLQSWDKWVASLAVDNKLKGGEHFAETGRVIRHGGEIDDVPFDRNKQSVLGFLLIAAESYEEASEIAKDCPILAGENNSVEIREITPR